VRLGARGYTVTVLEQLPVAGGRARVHRLEGYVFDAGPTIITAPFLLRELWSLAGQDFDSDIDLRAIDPFYRIRFDDGSVLDMSGDARGMQERIQQLAPQDVAGYEKFLRISETLYGVAFEELADRPFDSFWDMLRLTPKLLRLRSYRSVYAVAASCVRSPKLRFALSFHPLFVGGDPFRTPAFYALISHLERSFGVHFAVGGTGSIVAGLVRLIERQGGRLRFNCTVERILVEQGRVRGARLSSGEEVRADVVVSNADSLMTYRNLLPPSPQARRLRKARLSMGLFIWYFGTRKRYPDVLHHTILVGPRYRELIEDIFSRRQLAEDFSLYLHRPTATDESLAPPGCDAFYVLSPVPNLESGVDWAARAEAYRQAIEEHLARTVLPGLREHLTVSFVSTPQNFAQELAAPEGSAFGLEPRFLQSAWFRPHNRSGEFAGLYLVGAGTHPGAGVPGVLSSARVLDKVVPDARG
jgi:phytoene desaturase